MRSTILIASILAGIFAAGCSRHKAPTAADKTEARKEILALQKQFRTAVRSKDAAAVAALMTPDFTQVNSDGTTLARDAVETELKNTLPALRAVNEWTMVLDELTLDGDTATGSVHDSMVAIVTKKGGGTQTVRVKENTRTTWQKTPQGWRYKKITETSNAAGPAASDIDFVPARQWAKDARRERQALLDEQHREDANRAKPAAKAPAGMSPQQARQMLNGLYARYRKAIQDKDFEATTAFLSENYSVESGNSALPRWELEKSLRKDFERTRSIQQWTMDIEDVASHGDTLVVVLKESRSISVADSNGKVRQVRTNGRMRDTWLKTSGGWKMDRTEIIPGG